MAKAEVEGIVENAIKEGKIKAEAKASIVNFGLADKAGMITMINNIVVAEKKLSTVVDGKPAAPQTDAKAEFMANYKANKYVNNVAAYRADFKKAYGYEPKI